MTIEQKVEAVIRDLADPVLAAELAVAIVKAALREEIAAEMEVEARRLRDRAGCRERKRAQRERDKTVTSTVTERDQPVTVTLGSPNPPPIRDLISSPEILSLPDPERVEGPAEVSLLTFPCDGPVNAFAVTESLRAKHATAYPSLDVLGEYRQALAWVEAHPSRRKTAKGMPAFLVSWLGRAQNSGRGRDPLGVKLPPSMPNHRPAQLEQPDRERIRGSWANAGKP